MTNTFAQLARRLSSGLGSAWAFIAAIGVVLLWALLGPVAGFSAAWQLTINTGTTIVTFLMVFIIQNTQNRDSVAMHLKLDELVQHMASARNQLVGIEHATDSEVKRLEEEFAAVRTELAEGPPTRPTPTLAPSER